METIESFVKMESWNTRYCIELYARFLWVLTNIATIITYNLYLLFESLICTISRIMVAILKRDPICSLLTTKSRFYLVRSHWALVDELWNVVSNGTKNDKQWSWENLDTSQSASSRRRNISNFTNRLNIHPVMHLGSTIGQKIERRSTYIKRICTLIHQIQLGQDTKSSLTCKTVESNQI